MSTFSIIIATYGDQWWQEMAWERAYPCAMEQGADEVLQVHCEECSIAEARNAIADKARSDWLIFLDADDELEPGYVDAMRRHAVRVGMNTAVLEPKVSYVRRGLKKPAVFLDRRGDLSDDNFLILGTGIQRRLFEQVDGFGDYPHGFEDWSLWAKSWKEGAKIMRVPDATYVAYVNPSSKHRLAWKDRNWQEEMHHKVRRELFPELYR